MLDFFVVVAFRLAWMELMQQVYILKINKEQEKYTFNYCFCYYSLSHTPALIFLFTLPQLFCLPSDIQFVLQLFAGVTYYIVILVVNSTR